MKARDKDKSAYLRNFKAALKYKEIDKKEKLTEAEEIAVLNSSVKKLRDALEHAQAAGREEMIANIKAEIALAQSYLPETLNESEIETLARQVIAELGASGPSAIGMVMKGLMSKVAGRADGKVVKEIAQRLLS